MGASVESRTAVCSLFCSGSRSENCRSALQAGSRHLPARGPLPCRTVIALIVRGRDEIGGQQPFHFLIDVAQFRFGGSVAAVP